MQLDKTTWRPKGVETWASAISLASGCVIDEALNSYEVYMVTQAIDKDLHLGLLSI